MEESVEEHLNRRSLLGGGLVVVAGLLLGGCQSNTNRRRFGRFRKEGEDELPPRISTPPKPASTPRLAQTPVRGVISRREWTSAGPVMALANPMNGVHRITVHHSAVYSSSISSKADAARMMNSIRAGHLSQQWADIGYHYVVDPTGKVWEGRPVALQGAHVKDNNEHNLGIMMMGNFDSEHPTPQALAALDAFLADQMRRYRVPISRVHTHREIKPTACPGRYLQAHMVQARSRSGRLAMA
jgi:hypothetical protein